MHEGFQCKWRAAEGERKGEEVGGPLLFAGKQWEGEVNVQRR